MHFISVSRITGLVLDSQGPFIVDTQWI